MNVWELILFTIEEIPKFKWVGNQTNNLEKDMRKVIGLIYFFFLIKLILTKNEKNKK